MDEGSHQTRADWLTIGEMARRTRLTVKALRWYDEVGVLPPDHVDPASGYRHYRPEQVELARLVGLLRGLGMPLPLVAEFLAAPSGESLRTWWRDEVAQFRHREDLLQYLLITLSEGDPTMFDVDTREAEAEKVATITGQVLQSDLPQFIPDAIARLRRLIARQGADAKPFDLVMYHSTITPDVEGTVEVCVPFTGTVEPADDVVVRVEPARTEAFARVTKGQVMNLEFMHAFDAVGSWLRERGKDMAGSPREVYFADWLAVDEDTLAVDVAFPYVP